MSLLYSITKKDCNNNRFIRSQLNVDLFTTTSPLSLLPWLAMASPPSYGQRLRASQSFSTPEREREREGRERERETKREREIKGTSHSVKWNAIF